MTLSDSSYRNPTQLVQVKNKINGIYLLLKKFAAHLAAGQIMFSGLTLSSLLRFVQKVLSVW